MSTSFENDIARPNDPRPLTQWLIAPHANDFGVVIENRAIARESRMAIEQARKTVARLLHAHPAEIFFTSGGTESSNAAIRAAVQDLGCRHIVSSPLEHHATLRCHRFAGEQ